MYVYKQIIVTGRVQGVFFRQRTRQLANKLSLTGGVRNLYDGRVEVMVAGASEDVLKLIKWLETGPKRAKVSTIEVTDIAVDSLTERGKNGFAIWATR